MSDKINLLRRVVTLDVSPAFNTFSKIIINVDDETQFVVGDDSGRTLEYDDPFGTREQAERQLAALRGYQYQPYSASGALLDPAAEIGDGIAVRDTYGGLYQRSRTFDRLMAADIAAPQDEEINHEYQYVSPTERKYKRELGDVRATLLIQADRITAEVSARTEQGEQLTSQINQQATEIAAKVSQTGGSNSSFCWSLRASEFALYAGNKKVFKATSDGVEIDGKITARSGYIGNGTSGFTITASAIYNNISSFGGTQSKGVYIGTNGIQLGKNFKVDSSGNLTAASGTFTGSVSPLTSGALGGITGGTNFNNMDDGKYTAKAGSFSTLIVGGSQYTGSTISFIDGNGKTRSFKVLKLASD